MENEHNQNVACLTKDNERGVFQWVLRSPTKREKNGGLYMNIKRGDIYFADLSPVVGSEQGGIRPVLIIQNDIGNQYSPTVIAATVTSKTNKSHLPTHVCVRGNKCGLYKPSIVQLEQLRTIDKRRLRQYIGSADQETIVHINTAIAISCGIITP